MATLITGAGLIGASFAQHATRRGEEVIFIDPFPRRDFLQAKLGNASFEVVEDDVRNVGALVEVMSSRRIDRVLHTVSRIGHKAAKPLHEGYSLNVGGTQAVAEAVRLAKVRRLVHISTFGAYDWRRPTPKPIDEDFARGSGAPYSNFKVAQELILEAYQKTYGFELIVLRPANTFGVGHFWGGSGGGEKLQDLVIAGIEGRAARIPQEQTMAFEYVYAKDVGGAIDRAMTCPAPKHMAFNIGTGVTTTFAQLVAAMKARLPNLTVEIERGTPPQSRLQHLDLTRAREDLGWTPTYTLETGLDDYIAELRKEHG